MSYHSWRRNILIILGICGMLLYGSPVKAARWYEYYLEAQDAAAVGDWEKAIDLYKKAIEKEPKPEKGKRAYGMRRIDYYPYLELGKAYFNAGDLANSCLTCRESEKIRGSSQNRDQCLFASSLSGRYANSNAIPYPNANADSDSTHANTIADSDANSANSNADSTDANADSTHSNSDSIADSDPDSDSDADADADADPVASKKEGRGVELQSAS